MVEFQGINWTLYHGALVPDTAPHVEIDLGEDEARHLLKKTGAYFIRWSTGFDQTEASDFWHVIKDGSCEMQDLSKNTRNQVRKALKNCSVQPIAADDLARDGYGIYRNAMESYQTDIGTIGPEEFRAKLALSAHDPSQEFWAVRDHQGNLMAYAQNRIQDETCNYQVIKLDPAYSHLYPGYALLFEMTRHYLMERAVRYVNDGARSIRHQTNVQDFLIRKFRFRKAYSRLHITYSGKMGILVKTLYPLRNIVKHVPGGLAIKVNSILLQENIRRNGLG
jgi:hypothetical protein